MNRLYVSPNGSRLRISPSWNPVSVLQRVREFAECLRPTPDCIDVLCVGNEKRRVKGCEANRNDEVVIANRLPNVVRDLNFVPNALFVHRCRRPDEKHLRTAMTNRILKPALPV